MTVTGVTSCTGKHMTSLSFLTLVLPFPWLIFRNFFHTVNNTAIKQQQYCNTVRRQLNSDRLTQHMTSQTWRLKRLFLNDSSPLIRVMSICTTSNFYIQILWYYKRNYQCRLKLCNKMNLNTLKSNKPNFHSIIPKIYVMFKTRTAVFYQNSRA